MAPALTVRQLNDLYNRSPNAFVNKQVPLADPMQALYNTALKRPPTAPIPKFPPPAGVPALLSIPAALTTALALVLLTPKPTANEDAILRKLKKEEIERKITLDPPESPLTGPPPFIGGQTPGTYYQFDYTITFKYNPSALRPLKLVLLVSVMGRLKIYLFFTI